VVFRRGLLACVQCKSTDNEASNAVEHGIHSTGSIRASMHASEFFFAFDATASWFFDGFLKSRLRTFVCAQPTPGVKCMLQIGSKYDLDPNVFLCLSLALLIKHARCVNTIVFYTRTVSVLFVCM
jgi:hypothetical protein